LERQLPTAQDTETARAVNRYFQRALRACGDPNPTVSDEQCLSCVDVAAFSAVIPAHNEESTVVRLLSRLRELGSSVEVVVVCNGCSDGTAERAREIAPWAEIVEIPEASKTAALQRGDEIVATMPRLYLDADVVIEGGGLHQMVETLAEGPWLAVAPTPRYVFGDAGWPVRGHYRIWAAIQAMSTALTGTGAILMSAAGRERFSVWPDVIGDDYFVNGLFGEDERTRVDGVEVIVELPTHFRDCISRKARVHQGNRQVEGAGLRRVGSRGSQGRQLVALVRARPSLMTDPVTSS
jgi:glycosyltransferase involved in cell wall biosynthesis